MSGFWNSLSPFTRRLAIVVVAVSAIGLYTKMRLQPQRAEILRQEKRVAQVRGDLQEARKRVDRLRRQATSAERWATYALVLDQQSTGRSLKDVLETCGTKNGPQLNVHDVRFNRVASANGFGRMGVSFQLEGHYAELIRLLHDLDETFPPIEITRTELRLLREQGEQRDRGRIEARLEGVIYEPR